MAAGVTMADPDTVWLSADTKFARRRHDRPQRALRPRRHAWRRNVEIKAFCDIEGARIGRGAIIGPFARIRPGSDVAEDVHIGNFVELKATRMGRGAKANHLAYLGDSDIGAASNIGAGTIAVNYDGYGKWRTVIGADAFIGSNSSLVAPVRIGKGANVTAGSVITEDVPAGAVAFGRARQVTKKGRAAPLRAKLKARRRRLPSGPKGRIVGTSMCGIIGIIGKAPVTPLLVDALKRLEYRGYDSAGRRHPGERPHRAPPRRGQAGQPRGPARPRAAGRHDRHRPHALGDPRQAVGAQRPSHRHRPGGDRAQRHHRELPGAEGRAGGRGPPLRQRHRHRGGGPAPDLACSSARCRPRRRWARRWSGCAAPSRWSRCSAAATTS